jgi:hypothetical protein
MFSPNATELNDAPRSGARMQIFCPGDQDTVGVGAAQGDVCGIVERRMLIVNSVPAFDAQQPA